MVSAIWAIYWIALPDPSDADDAWITLQALVNVLYGVALLSMLLPPGPVRLYMNRTTSFLMGIWTGYSCLVVSFIVSLDWSTYPRYARRVLLDIVYFVALTIAIVCGSEADRMHLAEAIEESANLREGFSGRVSNAQSSVEQDRVSILSEIRSSGEESSVDISIEVLLRSGMSTESLRQAAAMGNRQ